jgi:hypothetical protein
MAESVGMLSILESLGGELLRVRPSAFGLKEEKLEAVAFLLRVIIQLDATCAHLPSLIVSVLR